ncbi:MAG: hypothetical protein WCC21_10120 [Candidatus Acidiferrales bacterium]
MADLDIPSSLSSLGSPELAERERAARALFEAGSTLARGAISRWLDFPPLAALLTGEASDGLEITVGIAVQTETFDRLQAANGSPRLADVPPDQDAKEFELEFQCGVRLDILSTRQPGGGGAIDRFLGKFGEGIQQIEIAVRDVDRATDALRDQFSIAPIYPAARPGAGGTRVNFFLVPADDRGKVLIEFVENRQP